MIPDEVTGWIEANNFGELQTSRTVGGGCINNGAVLKTTTGASFFLKTNRSAPADMFAREAEGLVALRVADGPVVPEPLLHGASFLLLEDLAPASKVSGYWREFGRRLAFLHKHINERFGFEAANYIGSTPQPNPWTGDGWEFFARHRLMFQARLAHDQKFLSTLDVGRVERLAGNLEELVPEQPASLIHGDLWGGNAISDSSGNPAVIDPAAHFGWAEAELAMTTLFGSFPNEFYDAYQEVRPLENGYESRYPLYNLYHLLNHLNLFGRSYLGQVQSTLRRYGN